MKKKAAFIVLILSLLLFVAACSSSKSGMRKTKHRKCNCPTFSYVPRQTDLPIWLT
ncbi:MAG: hypothetical protein LBO06_00440 [Bacteroidales bacterium]|jgi:hypothetical protein|nr:hypothetical protein [Bacteroidales bacterium]